jgi:hypothetical protein
MRSGEEINQPSSSIIWQQWRHGENGEIMIESGIMAWKAYRIEA